MAFRRQPVALSAILPRVVGGSPARPSGVIDEMTWRRAVGVHVAKRTRPMRIEDGRLWVKVATSAWAQELSLLSATLVKRLAEMGIKVTDVRFRVGKIEPLARVPDEHARIRSRAPTPAALPRALGEQIAAVPDPEVAAAIAAAAAQNLAWQRAQSDVVEKRPSPTPALRGGVTRVLPATGAPVRRVDAQDAVTSAPRAAPDPRYAARGSARSGPGWRPGPAASPGSRGSRRG